MNYPETDTALTGRIATASLFSTKLILYWLSFSFFVIGLWLNEQFGDVGFGQVLYHIQIGYDGLIDADSRLIKSFITNCLAYPLLFAVGVLYIEHLLRTFRRRLQPSRRNSPTSASDQSAQLLDFGQTVVSFVLKFLPLFVISYGIYFLLSEANFWFYVKNFKDSNFIAEHYVMPAAIAPPEHKRKNLVLIYAESLEQTYSDTDAFGKDLLGALNSRTAGAYSFDNFRQTTGTGWTIAGIVSTQCGIPLKTSLFGPNLFGQEVKHFLPDAICLGDIFRDAGYRNVFMGGAALSFGGKGKFLQQHGYTELYGKEYWKSVGEEDFNEWGLYDDSLFIHARDKIDELEQAGTPYNLTLLTLDTHHPGGNLSPTCRNRGIRDFEGIVECSSGQIADFLEFMENRNYLGHTNVVILGDHLAMENPVSYKLLRARKRSIYNRFITDEPLKKNRDEIYHFSILPTVLHFMGFQFDQNRMGLGVSGFGEIEDGNYLHQYNNDVVATELAGFSKKYLEFWQVSN